VHYKTDTMIHYNVTIHPCLTHSIFNWKRLS